MHVEQQFFFSQTHELIIESGSSDTEICGIVGEGIIDLTVSDSPSHHNVSCSMGFGEHVFDLFAGPYVPIRHIVLFHLFFPFRLQSFSFTHAFHDGKGLFAVHPFSDEIYHNIITGTDCSGNGRLSFLNQSLGISKPNVCTVGKSCNTHKIREMGRFRIDQHLHGKFCTKFRDAKGAKGNPTYLFRSNSKGFCAGKKRHNLLIVQWDLLCINPRQILQHADHGWIIMTENIKF